MFSLEILDTLASGLGDFARGAKKLRSVVLSVKKSMEENNTSVFAKICQISLTEKRLETAIDISNPLLKG